MLYRCTENISSSNCAEVFCKKGVLTNFAKFTGEHLLKRDSNTGVFL